MEQKVESIKAFLCHGSVLVYATRDLLQMLQGLNNFIIIDENVDPKTLQQLDRPPYKLMVSLDSFGMRGLDYRSKSNVLYLVIAKQFSNVREALQGVARVGRFGDPCYRIKFTNCDELVN